MALACGCAVGGSAARAQTYAAVGASLPIGDFAPAANAGFGLALQSRTGQTFGVFDTRLDVTLDRFGGKGAISRYQYTSFAVNLIRDIGESVYWLAGIGLYNAQDQLSAQFGGNSGTLTHSNGGVKAGVGATFTVFRVGSFIEADVIRLFAPGKITWVPIRLGIRL